MNYIFLFFIPGSAGHFVSRVFNLLDKVDCWTIDEHLPSTLEDKWKILNFDNVIHRRTSDQNWLLFEDQVRHYTCQRNHNDIPDLHTSLWCRHGHGRNQLLMLPGNNDTVTEFVIDISGMSRWVVANCWFKNSRIDVSDLKVYRSLIDNPGIHKINLANILRDEESFVLEITKAFAIANLDCSANELNYVIKLYHQWIKTTLKTDQIDDFFIELGLDSI